MAKSLLETLKNMPQQGGFNAPAVNPLLDPSAAFSPTVNPIEAPVDILQGGTLSQAPQQPQSGLQVPPSASPTPTQPQAPASDGSQIPKFGEEGFQFAERGSPQDFFLSQTNDGTTALSQEQIDRGQAFADQRGMNFDPLTGFSQGTEAAPQQGLTSGGDFGLTGFNPRFKGQTPSQFMRGEDTAASTTFQGTDAQGRLRQFDSPEAQQANIAQGQADFAQASTDREARIDENFGKPRGPDSRDRDRRGTMSMADATQLTGGDRGAARALLKRQELGLGEFEPDTPSPSDVLARDKFEASQAAGGDGPSTAQQRLDFDKEKHAALVAKEAAGTPLTPSEQLARERFEFDQQQAAAGPAKSVMDRNIERLMEANQDMSFSEAVNIAQGVISKTVDPTSGNIQTTNIATGTSTPVKSTAPLPSSTLDLDPIEPGTSLFERGQKFTGAIESGLRGAQRVVGQFGGKIASDESQQTKKELDAFQGSLVRAFQENDKFSIGQDKVLRAELDATLGAMKDPETFKNNAIALDKVMRQRHADLMENHRTLSFKDDFRSDSLSKARVLETAIRDLGVTQEDPGAPAVEAPPEGINQEAAALWEFMDEAGRASFQPKAK